MSNDEYQQQSSWKKEYGWPKVANPVQHPDLPGVIYNGDMNYWRPIIDGMKEIEDMLMYGKDTL